MLRSPLETAQTAEPHRLVVPAAVQRGRGRRIWITALAIAALGAAAFGVRAFTGGAAPGPRFRTWAVERRTVTSVIEAAGQLDVPVRVEVPAPIGAPLVEIAVEAGATVKEGQVLARLDPRSARTALSSARAALEAARAREAEALAQLRGAEDGRKRTEALVAKGLAGDGDLVAARAAEDRARAVLAATRAEGAKAGEAVRASDADLTLRTLRSPMDGIVLSAPRWQGFVAAPDKGPLFVIGSPIDVLRLEVAVGEADIGSIQPKQKATFTVPAFPTRELDAEVEQVRIEASKRDGAVTFPVLLRAPNSDKTLLPGMTATARIRVAEAASALVVRDAALRFTPEDAPPAAPRTRVWVSRDGVAIEPVAVTAGVSDGVYTEVRPAAGAALDVGSPVVVGLAPASDSGGTAGISLGSKK
jgi:HlyD family secretion protein